MAVPRDVARLDGLVALWLLSTGLVGEREGDAPILGGLQRPLAGGGIVLLDPQADGGAADEVQALGTVEVSCLNRLVRAGLVPAGQVRPLGEHVLRPARAGVRRVCLGAPGCDRARR